MLNIHKVNGRRLRAISPLALFSLAASLDVVQNASAQVCGGGFDSAIAITQGVVHVGDTITIGFLQVSSSANTCSITNGRSWLIYPDNNVVLWLDNFTLGPNSSITCPGDASCLAGSFTYVVN